MFFIYSMCSVAVGGRLQFSGGGCSNMASASICVLIHSCKMLPKEIGTTGLRGLLQLRYEHVTIRVRFEYYSSTIRLKHATTRYEDFRALAYEIDSSTPRESVVVVSCMLIDSSMHTIFALYLYSIPYIMCVNMPEIVYTNAIKCQYAEYTIIYCEIIVMLK